MEVMRLSFLPLQLIPMLLVLLTGCASGAHKWNPDEVVADVLTRGYRFSGPQRETAIEDVAERDGTKSVATLRRIAEMTRSLEPKHELADLLAIKTALVALTRMNDAHAVELNRRRLSDDSFRGIALINLTSLKAWNATGDVESWFATAPLRREEMYVISEAATFLSLSPRSTSASCAAIERIRRTFPECLYSTTDYRCMDLDGSLINLSSHLRCFDVK